MRRYFIINLIFLTVICTVSAQNVAVSGQLKGFEQGSMVRIIVPEDLFSKLEHTLVTTYAGQNGDFAFHVDMKYPVYAHLAVNLKKGSIFLEPGQSYQMKIVRDTIGQHGSIFDQQPPEIDILKGNTSLSNRLGNFNEIYNQFLLAHFRDIYLYHNTVVLNNFKKEIAGKFSNDNSPYVKNYIRYSLASLEWAARTSTLNSFGKKYFVGQTVLYNNVQYVEMFRDFFKAFFESTLHDPVNMNHLAEIMPTGNFQKLDEVFSKVPLLETDTRVRELTEMVSLEKYFYNNDFNRWNILRMYENMSLHCKYPENRKIAHDYYEKLKQLIPGSNAPDFDLPGFSGKEYTLESFKHKFVLLAFFKTNNPMCENQLSYLKKLSDHEDDDFTPVVIVAGKNPDYYLKAYSSQQYPWPFLLLGKDILLLEKYQVVDYPSYVLINPDGSIAMAPAPMPEENAFQRISDYITEYKKNVKN
ncbi:MAG: redoxin domain-containing protein [Bacteroidales bacterium]|nr:redoxin domain-containing protein [Bacteroidales bacterium]